MGIISYAQNFEDVILWRALSKIKNGFYIDVGAQDPQVDSVSRAFYENGWKGVHIEATTEYANKIRNDRPDELVIEAALSDLTGSMTFYQIPGTGLSTGDTEVAMKHKEMGLKLTELTVNTVTLDEIFLQIKANEVHWLKIDVEGMEKKVIDGWRDNSFRPWVLVIESTYPNTQVETHEKWEQLLLDKGYDFVYFDGLSRFYLHKEQSDLAHHFRNPPNVFDKFLIAKNSHFSIICNNEIQEKMKEIAKLKATIENYENKP